MNEFMPYVQHLIGCPEREGKYFQGKKLAPNVEVNAHYLVCPCGAWNDPRRPRYYTCQEPSMLNALVDLMKYWRKTLRARIKRPDWACTDPKCLAMPDYETWVGRELIVDLSSKTTILFSICRYCSKLLNGPTRAVLIVEMAGGFAPGDIHYIPFDCLDIDEGEYE